MGSLSEIPHKDLPVVQRFITTHEPTTGSTTFKTPIPEAIDWERSPLGGDFALLYSLTAFPASLPQDADLATYQDHLVNKPPFMIPGGAVVRYVDYHPNVAQDVWHRTVTLDIGICVEGEIELELESGEKRLMKRGDVTVMRGTNHCWRNPSKTQFARVLYVALDAKPAVVNGVELGESMGKLSGH